MPTEFSNNIAFPRFVVLQKQDETKTKTRRNCSSHYSIFIDDLFKILLTQILNCFGQGSVL